MAVTSYFFIDTFWSYHSEYSLDIWWMLWNTSRRRRILHWFPHIRHTIDPWNQTTTRPRCAYVPYSAGDIVMSQYNLNCLEFRMDSSWPPCYSPSITHEKVQAYDDNSLFQKLVRKELQLTVTVWESMTKIVDLLPSIFGAIRVEQYMGRNGKSVNRHNTTSNYFVWLPDC